MQTTDTNSPANGSLPFVGRRRELAQLEKLHAERRHVLIVGPAGVGKSALVRHAVSLLPLLVCPDTPRLTVACAALENALGFDATGGHVVARKNRLLQLLPEGGRTVVFDAVGWTTPKLSSFLECATQRMPVWIVTRSDHSWDIGHLWPLLTRFERLELQPFQEDETQALVEAAVSSGAVPADALKVGGWLHRRSAGLPLVLRELLEELATGRYDLGNALARRRGGIERRAGPAHWLSRQRPGCGFANAPATARTHRR